LISGFYYATKVIPCVNLHGDTSGEVVLPVFGRPNSFGPGIVVPWIVPERAGFRGGTITCIAPLDGGDAQGNAGYGSGERGAVKEADTKAGSARDWIKGFRRHFLVGPPHLWKMKRRFQMQFLKQRGLQPEHFLLDLGCGTLRGGLPLVAYLEKEHYYGVDIRPEALEEGRKELLEAGQGHKEPVLTLGDRLTNLDLERKFHFIWSFSVLIHMTDGILSECLDCVARHLTTEGTFYANVLLWRRIELPWLRWRGFPVVVRSLAFYEEQAALHGLEVKKLGQLRHLGHRSGMPGQDRQQMLAFRLTGAAAQASGKG
jgi:hypothetical protein